jgi:hypothetical protein
LQGKKLLPITRVARPAARTIIDGRISRRLWIFAIADTIVAFLGSA